jgi:GT2 family glycosyltransferase
MLIRRSVIQKYGLFDAAYGRGYGEENDFCMRVRKRGYRHFVANKAYVFHEGSKSFTDKSREELYAANAKILSGRYPEYDQLVQEYITQNVLPEQVLFSDDTHN